VSLAISKMRLLEQANQRTTQLAMLNRIGVTLTSGLDFSSVIRTIFEQCRLALEMDVFYLALYDERSGMADFPILYQDGAYQVRESLEVDSSPGLVSHVIRTRSSLVISDLIDPHTRLPFSLLRTGNRPARSVLAAPLLLEDRVVGVISGQSYRAYAYRQEDLNLLETLAAQAVVALENARLYGEVRRLSTIDELTGLNNYRSLLELGTREVDRARRFGRPLSALFFDVDHFREFNNRYSHATGNIVLRGLARIVLDNLRGVDLLFRYGGEEFVALLPETGLDTAARVAERLRGAVAGLEIPSEWGDLAVTISLGVASLSDEMADLEALLASADLAEKRAKELGRNRVVVNEETQAG
jgi:diguanylate cyclase (GGDEF)-like protein